ncbi:hypothetical protein FS749_007122 [Ceratobasidium sp. UAMH 11750]|nr:hypothetical protein FS749_007122 [Ceratobasidium sp. UAMH 11750]
MSDIELQEFERGTKRTRIQEEAGDQDDQGDIQTTEAPWKRPRLTTLSSPSTLEIGEPAPYPGDIDPGTEPVCDSGASLEDITDNPITPTPTEVSTPRSSPPQPVHNLTSEERPTVVQSCASTPDCLHCSIDPSSLLADAFIYVAHRSAPHPTNLMPAARRVFSQDALLAGLDWTGAKRKRRALVTHIPTNQVNQMTRIRKGMVVVDYRRDDTQAIVNWAQSLGTPVHPSHLGKYAGATMLCVVAPKAKYPYNSKYSMEGLELEVLCVVICSS